MKRLLGIRLGNASIVWYIKQLFPMTYWTVVERCPGHEVETGLDCHKSLNLWKMWLGRCYDVTLVPLD